MPTRASDRVTLAVLPAPSYVRTYYLLQSSTATAPAIPTANPPASPWTTTEPTYTAGATVTLYTTQLVAYGSAAFEYGPVQVSSAFEAAKQAYNLASQANGLPRVERGTAVPTASAPTAPNGSFYFRHQGSTSGPMIASYTRVSGAWVETPLIIRAGQLEAGEVTGLLVKTAGSGQRVELRENRIDLYDANGDSAGWISGTAGVNGPLAHLNGLQVGQQYLGDRAISIQHNGGARFGGDVIVGGQLFSTPSQPYSIGVKEPWVKVTPTDGSWSVADAFGYRGLSVRRIGDQVYLSGAIVRTGGSINGGFIGAVIPAGYRPAMREWVNHVITGGRVNQEITVQPNGNLQFDLSASIPANVYVFFNAQWTLG